MAHALAMHVIRHSDPDAFLAAVAPMHARGEASASVFVGHAHALKRGVAPADEHVYLATCGDGDVFGAALQRGDGPVIVGASDPAGATAFADDLAGGLPRLQGVVGALAACEAFARRWRELTGRSTRVRFRMRQHALSVVNALPPSRGMGRIATAADTEWLIECAVAFVAEVGVPDPPERVRRVVPERAARGDFRIWEDDGPVAYAGFTDAAPDFARIAPVYTLPERRGRGYATALVGELARELLAGGKRRVFLTTDAANPTSNAIYARIGFRAESEDWHLDFVDAAD